MFKVPYIIPKSLEQRRPEFESALLSAQRSLRKQAQRYVWENLTDEPFLFLAEIYRTYNQMIKYFVKKSDLPTLVSRAGKPDFQSWLEKLID